ncbi:CapA family protein [Thermodesulfobacteriota bacterium]
MSTSKTHQTIGVTGDWLLTRPLSLFREESYLKMRNILASSDAVFANLEASVHPYLDDPLAQRMGGGSYMTTEPSLLADMKWLGVNLVACGSSHADDYGPKGILDTMRYFDEAGIVHAG